MDERAKKLDYASPHPSPSPSNDSSSATTAAVVFLLVPTIPLLGFMLRIGVLFVFGGLATLPGLAGSIMGLVLNFRKPIAAQVWTVSILANAIGTWYFFWLIFIRGLC